MFLHGQDTVTAGEAETKMEIQTANRKLPVECIILFGALCTFAGVPVFLYNCVDVFRPYLFHPLTFSFH